MGYIIYLVRNGSERFLTILKERCFWVFFFHVCIIIIINIIITIIIIITNTVLNGS